MSTIEIWPMKTQSFIFILKTQQPEIIENDLIERYIYNSWAFEGSNLCYITEYSQSFCEQEYYSTLYILQYTCVRQTTYSKNWSSSQKALMMKLTLLF